jgi:predicted SnoaL-like aldol condensation-catalyzing enzyme
LQCGTIAKNHFVHQGDLMRASLKVGLITALLFSCGAVVHAQDAVVGVADADALFHSKNPKQEKNKQAAYHIMKELLEANHWEMADKWITERYIQHNPQAASGRDGVVKFFTQVLKRQPSPVPDKLGTKIVSVVAEGDYVIVTQPRQMKDSKDPTKTYTTTWFDMWRFVDGKADEHWDPAMR